MRTRTNHSLYFTVVALFTLLVATGVAVPAKRIALFGGAFIVLLVGYAVEQMFTRDRKSGHNKHRKWIHLGDANIAGSLCVSDQYRFTSPTPLILPKDEYSIEVEEIVTPTACYIAGIRLQSRLQHPELQVEHIKVTVDSGFLLFAWVDIHEAVTMAFKAGQDKILDARSGRLDAEIISVNGKRAGIVVASGLGDDQYILHRKSTTDNRATLVCEFIQDLNEAQ